MQKGLREIKARKLLKAVKLKELSEATNLNHQILKNMSCGRRAIKDCEAYQIEEYVKGLLL